MERSICSASNSCLPTAIIHFFLVEAVAAYSLYMSFFSVSYSIIQSSVSEELDLCLSQLYNISYPAGEDRGKCFVSGYMDKDDFFRTCKEKEKEGCYLETCGKYDGNQSNCWQRPSCYSFGSRCYALSAAHCKDQKKSNKDATCSRNNLQDCIECCKKQKDCQACSADDNATGWHQCTPEAEHETIERTLWTKTAWSENETVCSERYLNTVHFQYFDVMKKLEELCQPGMSAFFGYVNMTSKCIDHIPENICQDDGFRMSGVSAACFNMAEGAATYCPGLSSLKHGYFFLLANFTFLAVLALMPLNFLCRLWGMDGFGWSFGRGGYLALTWDLEKQWPYRLVLSTIFVGTLIGLNVLVYERGWRVLIPYYKEIGVFGVGLVQVILVHTPSFNYNTNEFHGHTFARPWYHLFTKSNDEFGSLLLNGVSDHNENNEILEAIANGLSGRQIKDMCRSGKHGPYTALVSG